MLRKRRSWKTPTEATELFEAYLKSPNAAGVAQAKTRLGYCYYRTQDAAKIDRAEKLWQEVIQRGPPTDEWVIESHWYQIQLLTGPQRQWQKAIPELDVILRDAKPGTFRHEQALFTKAWLFWAHQQWNDAQKAFTLLVQLYPEKQKHEPIQSYLKDCEAKKSS